MITNFGENLKSLRKKKNLTQDEIARILSVSTQSVSRWETNMGYPDIEMLPAIANFHGVTVDSLLCLDVNKKNEKIAEILSLVYSHKTKGENNICIDLLRNALKEFPYDFKLMSNLSFCLFNYGESDEEMQKNNEEVIEICENILKDCTEDSLRHSAIQLLCFVYPTVDKKDTALELAKRMPSYYITSNELVKMVLIDEDKKKHIQENLLALIQLISTNAEELFIFNTDFEEKVNILNSILNIYESFFDKEDYYFFHCRVHRIYRYLAALHADNKEYDETIEYIKKSAHHAIAFDTRPNKYTYTSSLIKGSDDSINNSVKKTTQNYSWSLLDKLNDERYEFVINDERVLKIIVDLKQVAKE